MEDLELRDYKDAFPLDCEVDMLDAHTYREDMMEMLYGRDVHKISDWRE